MRCLLLLVLVACASAGRDNPGNPDGNTDGKLPTDGSNIDGPPNIDAPISLTLQQNNSAAVAATMIACQNATTGATRENSYYRVFPLTDHGVTGAFYVTQVTFAVERATAGTGTTQPAQVKLGTYSGTVGAATLNTAQITPIASATISITNGATSVVVPASMFTPPNITIPMGSNVVAEVFIPDGNAANNIFYIGSNNGGETRPSYIRGPTCGSTSPSTYASIGQPQIQLVLSVSGTH